MTNTQIIIVTAFLLFFFVVRPMLKIWSASHSGRLKGWWGEQRVARCLSKLPAEYRVFNDVYIDSRGHSIQIDHLVISPYGIFVIETKNYSGYISGKQEWDMWYQRIYGHRYTLYNPIRQNTAHVTALQHILTIPATSFFPIVVFANKARLRCETASPVLKMRKLLGYIQSNNTILLTPDIVSRLSDQLTTALITDRNKENQHINETKRIIAEKEEKIARGICPRCGGKLIERKGKYGPFLGCSNYPYCKFLHNL